jgi:hypothetical protein
LVKPFEQPEALYRTGISVGDYPVDHHHHKNSAAPKIKFTPVNSYNIPLGCLIPESTDGLIAAEKNISVSNIVNGTTRLQPVVLLTGQAAGALAAYSVQNNRQLRKANVRDVQQILLDAKCYLVPYVDVKPADPFWEAIQKAGVTGILKGIGKSEGWANKTYFYPDSTITIQELEKGLSVFNKYKFPVSNNSSKVDVRNLAGVMNKLFTYFDGCCNYGPFSIGEDYFDSERLNETGLTDTDIGRPLKRKEIAYLLLYYFDYFKRYKTTLKGEMIPEKYSVISTKTNAAGIK